MTQRPALNGLAYSKADDLLHAGDVFDLTTFHKERSAARGFTQGHLNFMVREGVRDYWTAHRLWGEAGKERVRNGKIPLCAPWSVAARRQAADGIWKGLVVEHVIPMKYVVAAVLACDDPTEVAEVLNRMLILAVVTKAEDDRLNAMGLRQHHPNPEDVWLRYRLVDIEMEATPMTPADAAPVPEVAADAITESDSESVDVDLPQQPDSTDNGLRAAREAKDYSRIGMSVQLGISTTDWWNLENFEPVGTDKHSRTLTAIADLPLCQEPDTIKYSNYECPHCHAQPGDPCRTKANTPTSKPHGNRRLGGY